MASTAAGEIIEQELGKIEEGVKLQVSAAARRIAKQRIQKELKCMLTELDLVADALRGVVDKIGRARMRLDDLL